MKFDELENYIQKECLEDMLKPFSPYVAYRKEYRGQHYPGYEIGINTTFCKFLVVWEEESDVMIAPQSSNFENTRENWFSLERIVCFLTRQPFIWDAPYQPIPHNEKLIREFHVLKEQSIPYINQIVSMFSSSERMSKWLPMYEKYDDEQFRLKFPNFYEEYKRRKSERKP